MGNTKKTRHQKKYTIRCDWCGKIGPSSRAETKTCGEACRKNASLFRKFFGYDPLVTPGPCTFLFAKEDEIDRLIGAERVRLAAAKKKRQA